MANQEAINEFKSMTLKELHEFLTAHDQTSYAEDSRVRLFCKKHYPYQYNHGITFALTMMYIDLSYALYESLQVAYVTLKDLA